MSLCPSSFALGDDQSKIHKRFCGGDELDLPEAQADAGRHIGKIEIPVVGFPPMNQTKGSGYECNADPRLHQTQDGKPFSGFLHDTRPETRTHTEFGETIVKAGGEFTSEVNERLVRERLESDSFLYGEFALRWQSHDKRFLHEFHDRERIDLNRFADDTNVEISLPELLRLAGGWNLAEPKVDMRIGASILSEDFGNTGRECGPRVSISMKYEYIISGLSASAHATVCSNLSCFSRTARSRLIRVVPNLSEASPPWPDGRYTSMDKFARWMSILLPRYAGI